jgi:acyl-CoA synthetase (AMP-forming)/AMP-acid ligase II
VKKLNLSFREGWKALTGSTLREAAWGMTETHSFDTFSRGFQNDSYDLGAQQIFCGLPVPDADFKIMEFGGEKLLPLGVEGELCVRTPSLLSGYWNKPSASGEGLPMTKKSAAKAQAPSPSFRRLPNSLMRQAPNTRQRLLSALRLKRACRIGRS